MVSRWRALGEGAERAVVHRQQLARVLEKGRALGRQLHVPRCALHQPAAEPLLEPLELETDAGLRGLQRLGREREAAELDDADEGQDGIEIEGARNHFKKLSLI